jgi:hypothetical protein
LTRQRETRIKTPIDYAARVAANRASLREYNDAIEARIERERVRNTPSFEDTMRLDMPFLLSVVRMVSRGMSLERQAAQKITSGVGGFADNVITPLGYAAPFELGESPSFGDSFDIAKTPNNGEPGTWYTNSGSGQMRLYGNNGKGYIDLDFDHKHGGVAPHAHNWVDGNRDWAVVPFSLMPY